MKQRWRSQYSGRLRADQTGNGGSFPGKTQNSFHLQIVHTYSEDKKISYSKGTGAESSEHRLTTYLHLVLRLRMRGVIPPLLHMPSRRMQVSI